MYTLSHDIRATVTNTIKRAASGQQEVIPHSLELDVEDDSAAESMSGPSPLLFHTMERVPASLRAWFRQLQSSGFYPMM